MKLVKILALSVFFQTSLLFCQIFCCEPTLFNAEQKNLGLDFPKGIQTYTVFEPSPQDKKGDKFCNGAVITEFKGALYCQWQSSLCDEDSQDTHVVYSISKDDGKTWCKPLNLANCDKKHFRSSGGWWVYNDTLIAYINEWQTNSKLRQGVTKFCTTKDGIKWSKLKSVKMIDGSPLRAIFEQDPHLISSNRILGAAHFQKGLFVCPIFTDDLSGVRGWQKAEFSATDGKNNTSVELEPSLFTRKDNSIVMIFRDQASSFKKLASISYDSGSSWSTVQKTDFPDARTKQSAGNLPDGTAFLVCCPQNSAFRYPLVLALSSDGFTFNRAFLLRDEQGLPSLKYSGKAKSQGFHYAKSAVLDTNLYTAYSVNKESIQITVVPLNSLIEE